MLLEGSLYGSRRCSGLGRCDDRMRCGDQRRSCLPVHRLLLSTVTETMLLAIVSTLLCLFEVRMSGRSIYQPASHVGRSVKSQNRRSSRILLLFLCFSKATTLRTKALEKLRSVDCLSTVTTRRQLPRWLNLRFALRNTIRRWRNAYFRFSKGCDSGSGRFYVANQPLNLWLRCAKG